MATETQVTQDNVAKSAKGRTCGACMLCCKLLEFEGLEKPAGKWCGHARQGAGCTIHSAKPEACKVFTCEWLTNEMMPDEWHPLRTKFFIFASGANQYSIAVDPGTPHAWKAEQYYGPIKQIAANYVESNILVVVCIGSRRIALLPDRDVELGPDASTREIILVRSATPDGPVYSVELGPQAA